MVLVELNQQKTEREAIVNFIFRRCIWVEWTLHAVLKNTDQSIMEIILVIEALTNDLYIAGYILCVNKRSLETVYYHCRVVFGVNQDSWFFFIFFYCLTSYFCLWKRLDIPHTSNRFHNFFSGIGTDIFKLVANRFNYVISPIDGQPYFWLCQLYEGTPNEKYFSRETKRMKEIISSRLYLLWK